MNLLAAFFLGLAGSLHCAAMCGPLVLAVNAARRQDPASPRADFAAETLSTIFAYHGGRLVTYGILGAVSGLIGAAIVFAGFQRWISIAAGCLILLGALTSFRAALGRHCREGGVRGQDKVWPVVARSHASAPPRCWAA